MVSGDSRLAALNQDKKIQVAGETVPSANEEYFLYQTLLGAWPMTPMDDEQYADFVGRIHVYMEKALREAKINTSWINPNTEYEAAFHSFLDAILDRSAGKPFLDHLRLSKPESPAPEYSTRFPRRC